MQKRHSILSELIIFPIFEVACISVPSLFPISMGTFVSIFMPFLLFEIPFGSVPSLWVALSFLLLLFVAVQLLL